MSKEQKSKLDPHAERIEEWFLQNKTLAEVQAQLAEDHVSVSLSRLSQWWSDRCSAKLQEKLLAQITTGARQVRDVEATLVENPSPQMETIISLNRVIVMQLATQAQADPNLLKLMDQLTRTAMEHASAKAKHDLKERELKLAERRVELLEKKAAAFDQAQKVMAENISPEEQRKRLKEILQ